MNIAPTISDHLGMMLIKSIKHLRDQTNFHFLYVDYFLMLLFLKQNFEIKSK